MFWQFPLNIQAYDTPTDAWYVKEFKTKKDLITYLDDQFPDEPQFYKLKNTQKWKETGNHYARTVTKPNFEGGRYHNFITGSVKQKAWRDNEKDRVLNGVIYDGLYVPPFYYWYLNFCPIYNDLLKRKQFADVWDGDLWYMQYVMRAILKGRHVGGVKGRQKGYSFKHMAILYWGYSWFENSVNTIGAYDEKLVKKSWRYLEGYRAHINRNTTWLRGPTIPKALEWNETQLDDDNQPQGLQSILKGITFKQSPFNDVGGPQTFFNYEEPGVSPTLSETIETIRPAVEKGSETVGIIIATGSVGALDDAQSLRDIFYNPVDYNFLPVKNVWDEAARLGDQCCIFISEAYNLLGSDTEGLVEEGRPFMDEDGNSDVEFALKWIERKTEQLKNSKKKAELKQLAISQKCTSPQQAFDTRTISEWPIAKLKRQQERIKEKEAKNLWGYKPVKGLLEENKDGKIIINSTNLPPEHKWPIDPTWEDKRGVCTMYAPPDPNLVKEMYSYYACVDAIEVDDTDTSESIASLDIFQAPILVSYTGVDGKVKTKVEGDKLVFTYRGRFKTPEETNEMIWLGIKMYNAFTYPERNKPNFINYMKRMGRAERYLAKEGDVPIFKDLNIKAGAMMNNSKYGFHTGDKTETWKLFKATGKEYFMTEYGRNTIEKKDGSEEVIKLFTGIDRIDDYWLLEEFIRHVEGKGNYDRMISFLGALFICKVYQQNGILKRRNEVKEEKKEIQYHKKPISLIGGYKSVNALTGGRIKKPRSLL